MSHPGPVRWSIRCCSSLHFRVPEVHRCLREGRTQSLVMPHADTLAMLDNLDEARSQIGLRSPDE